MRQQARWESLLRLVYGDAQAPVDAVGALLDRHRADGTGGVEWSERDAWLITYPDQFQRDGAAPLRVLGEFFDRYLAEALNGIHILPFFPWSSDDGYSIVDYRQVDPTYGGWSDIEALAGGARLMVDAVINHMSAESEWFTRWRAGDPAYAGFYRTAAPDADLSRVVRARQHPLLTPFETADGTQWVWTTFSADQVDLDFRTPQVLVTMLDVLLEYAARGVSMIRLDAIGFLWKEEQSTSIHLPQTHAIVQLLRACLDETYPHVGLISETNVPHAENVSYLGTGEMSEAQAVYQFTLPPLVLHSYATGDASALREWAAQLDPPPPGTTFLNFLASHDGVGLRPLEGILAADDVNRLADLARAHGGLVNSRQLPSGEASPYELNATWYELVRGPTEGDDALERHLGSHAVMLAVRGIPAIYVHSLFASANDHEGIAATGAARSINRRRFTPVDELERELADPSTRSARTLRGLEEMLAVRRTSPAFHPDAGQTVLETPPSVFGIERTAPTGEAVRVYVNVSGGEVSVPDGTLLCGRRAHTSGSGVALGPWGSAWMRP